MLNSSSISQVESIVGFFIFLLIIIMFTRLLKKKPRKRKYRYSAYEKQQIFTNQTKREAAAKHATFEKKSLLNKGETFALQHIHSMLMQKRLPLYIYPQVPLLAFIEETTVNSLQLHKGLRPDFILTDIHQNVVAVVEINGNGHHDKFDHTKEIILNSVGIAVINIDTNGWNRLTKISYKNHVVEKVDQAMNQYLSSL